MVAAPGKGAHGALGLAGVEADHVDDHIELAPFISLSKFRNVVSIAVNGLDPLGQAILALAAIEKGELRIALEQVLDNAGGDQSRAAEE